MNRMMKYNIIIHLGQEEQINKNNRKNHKYCIDTYVRIGMQKKIHIHVRLQFFESLS